MSVLVLILLVGRCDMFRLAIADVSEVHSASIFWIEIGRVSVYIYM
jgi:hypothetical protein